MLFTLPHVLFLRKLLLLKCLSIPKCTGPDVLSWH